MMKPLLLLALAYIAPALLFLLFAQGWTWLYAIPLALAIAAGASSAMSGRRKRAD